MPVVPNAVERLLYLRLHRAPGPFLDLFGAAGFHAAALALDLGILDAIASERWKPADLAADLGLNERGVEALLLFLEPLGYVTRTGDAYEATRLTRTWLAPGERSDVGPWLTFWNELVFPFWRANLETAVREGAPDQSIYDWFDEVPGRWETAQEGFLAVARLTAPEMVDNIRLPPAATRLLDVGGGHGRYSIEFCRTTPELEATVFDVPAVESVVRETAADEGYGDRVTFVGGDYLVDNLPGCDVALVFNVVHAHDPSENVELFERVRTALTPGGRVVVMDQFDDDSWFPTVETALGFVALTYLVTLGGRTYPAADVKSWLRKAGFCDVGRTDLRGAPGVSMLVGDVPR